MEPTTNYEGLPFSLVAADRTGGAGDGALYSVGIPGPWIEHVKFRFDGTMATNADNDELAATSLQGNRGPTD
jgi:hypothetical protein